MLKLDHLAVVCSDLASGTAWVETQLGIQMQSGGQHLRYGTHNSLLGLADGLYLEVIAKDPHASPYDGQTWFALDQVSGPPRLGNWICQTRDLASMLETAPFAVGKARSLTRGDLAWQITVPEDGSLPYGGAYPTLIQWAAGTTHPADRLIDAGCRLVDFTISHPDADHLRGLIPLDDARVQFRTGVAGFTAVFDTPHGRRVLA